MLQLGESFSWYLFEWIESVVSSSVRFVSRGNGYTARRCWWNAINWRNLSVNPSNKTTMEHALWCRVQVFLSPHKRLRDFRAWSNFSKPHKHTMCAKGESVLMEMCEGGNSMNNLMEGAQTSSQLLEPEREFMASTITVKIRRARAKVFPVFAIQVEHKEERLNLGKLVNFR